MTYCVAMRLAEGLVFVSDSRTNAGVDHIATFRKLHLFETAGERVIVLQSAGNLATTQSVISLLRQRCQQEGPHLLNVPTLYDAALLVGNTVREVIQRDGGPQQSSISFGCSMLIGGQIGKQPARLFSIYPEGNFIEATPDTPYFQIGESKYGKPIIDRVLTYQTPLDQAIKCALISMDSTLRSNLSVGLPLDLLCYRNDSLHARQQYRLTEEDPFYRQLRQAWSEGMVSLFAGMPDFPLNSTPDRH